jgi:hypothetical protein
MPSQQLSYLDDEEEEEDDPRYELSLSMQQNN